MLRMGWITGPLRPRWTLRNVTLASAACYVFYSFVTGTPLLSSNLPEYTGPYKVGTIDIESPCKPSRIGDVVYKDSGEPAFVLDTVLFSVFYPSAREARAQKPPHYWASKPLSLLGEGYAKFAHISNFATNRLFTLGLWTLAGGLQIPAYVDVPLYDARDSVAGPVSKRSHTVIVFSHGMASTRTDYTHYCAELASRGYIVAAIEHRDGSAPGSTITSHRGMNKQISHITPENLSLEPEMARFKEMQLAFRQAEIGETLRVLRSINEGDGENVFLENARNEGSTLTRWKDKLDLGRLVIAGHSYGATLALQALKAAPSESSPFRGAIILDPGKQSGPLNNDINVPTLIVHSNSWSSVHSIFYGRPHFEVVKDLAEGILARGKAAWFMTSLGTSHPSVTDAPLIEPLLLNWATSASIDVKEGLNQYVKVSEEFLRYIGTGEKPVSGILGEAVSHTKYDLAEKGRKTIVPEHVSRYWQIHVSPADV